jgi:hypothetical protein
MERVGVEQPRSAQVWAAIAARARQDGTAISPRHAVIACADSLAATGGAGLSVARNGAPRETVLASTPSAEELEELQFTLGQGPGMDAAAGRGPVLVADLTMPDARRRWPLFAPAAAERGIRGMFAFPVAVGAVLIGVLGVYRLQAGLLAPQEVTDGLMFADAVLALALDERGGIASGPDGLAEAAVSARRAQVHQATGMVAAQLDVSMPDALVVLRAHAYVTGQRLSDLVADLLARRVRLGPGPPRDSHQSSGSIGGDVREDRNSSPEQGRQQSAPRGEEE